MALTRGMLKGMGLTDEQIGAIIEEHAATVDGLKADRDKYKESAAKVPDLEQKIKEYEADTSSADWEKKYKDEHDAYEKYKNEIATKEKAATVEKAYRKLLKDVGIGEKHIDAIIRVTDFSDKKLDKDGNLENVDALKKSIEDDYSGFVTEKGTKGSDVETPPAGDGKKPESNRIAELATKYHDNLYGTSKEG